MKSNPWKTSLLVGTKVTLCAGSIAAIAWAVGVFNFDGEISSSHADITWFTSAPRSNAAMFGEALERLGHDEPQTFDLNGNTVYFSVNFSDREPIEIMREYQNEFTNQGLNKRPFYTLQKSDEMTIASLTGGIVPLSISPNSIVMGGMLNQANAKDKEGLKKLFFSEKDPHQIFRGHRHIQIDREPNARFATITATWSDDKFDYAKMIPGNDREGQSVDLDVPACPGCTRINSFTDLDPKSTFKNNIYVGSRSVEEIHDFYMQALTSRGWQPTEAGRVLEDTRELVEFPGDDATVEQFARDNEILTLTLYPNSRGGATVHAVRSK